MLDYLSHIVIWKQTSTTLFKFHLAAIQSAFLGAAKIPETKKLAASANAITFLKFFFI